MTHDASAQVALGGGETNVATGVAVLDHLLEELAATGGFRIGLEVAPDEPEAEVDTAGAMLGEAFRPLLTREGAARRGFGITPADEALAMVVIEVSGKALVVSNADLTSTRAGGLRTDLAAAFLRGFSESAGLTIHVRLIEGHDSQHVLEAIFKGLGVALARACADA